VLYHVESNKYIFNQMQKKKRQNKYKKWQSIFLKCLWTYHAILHPLNENIKLNSNVLHNSLEIGNGKSILDYFFRLILIFLDLLKRHLQTW